jgi:hypothetical protein
MSTAYQKFAAILLRQHSVSPDQLAEVQDVCRRWGDRLDRALLQLGYLTSAQIVAAWAEALELPFLDLASVTIPPSIIELLPESVARENVVLPVAVAGRALTVAVSNPLDMDLLQKLEFILNRPICPVLAPHDQIIEAINHYYGQSETESVDSMLVEFTDTAIDFTETDAGPDSEFEFALDSTPHEPGPALRAVKHALRDHPVVDRRATVRYYHRMNPERMFPLLVVLSRQAVQEVARRGVSQGQSETFQVAEGSLVEVEPILPGCACYPSREQVRVGPGEATVTFWVVPHVLGKVMQARVVVRQGGATLAEVPLQVRVVKQGVTLLVGGLGLVLPFVLLLLKHFKLDFESQLQDGFSLYAQVAQWLLCWLTPEVLGGLLLTGTAALYLWLRPRRRDVFWDVRTAGPAGSEQPAPTADPDEVFAQATAAIERGDSAGGELMLAELLETHPGHRPALLCLAERHHRAGNHPAALELYERLLRLGEARAVDFFRASLAAYRVGNLARALAILQQAERDLPPAQMKGPLWYNLGCFAARLGRFADSVRYLNRAVDAGFDDVEKYRGDPDLEALRWHAGFRQLLAGLGC